MESNAMFPGVRSGMLSLETPLNPQNPQNSKNPQNSIQFNQSPMVSYANNPSDHQLHNQTIKQPASYPYNAPKHKQLSPLSDEDDPGSASGCGFNPDDTNSAGNDDKTKFSPWQRMKWTDTMVRLLIMAVFYIGDEAGAEPVDHSKKKGAGGALQKKGKWKSVSRAMMEKGFYVSPQQCEDKFNDLNKRYKRVNDVLGRGTACRVVENQSLLESMDLSPKRKEEVKKLLNSKHSFFREMCAYHNSCGHLTGNADQTHQASHHHQPLQTQEQGNCSNAVRANGEEHKRGRIVESDDEGEGDDEDSEDGSADNSDDDDEDEGEAVSQRQNGGLDDPLCKKPRKDAAFQARAASSLPLLVNQLSAEANNVIQDLTKSAWEKKQWIKTRIMRLEEQRIGFELEALELEKQKLKWMRFSGKKEREMKRAKLENERRKLENDRMVLIIRQKEFELHHQHNHQLRLQQQQQQNPSSVTG